jgi:recombination protein RecA
VETIHTGLPILDAALGLSGLPRGCLVEVFGAESSGKTALALSLVASVQNRGGLAAFIDAEHALDARFAERLGVNLNELLFVHPVEGEQALSLAVALLQARTLDILVLDSLAAVTPASEKPESLAEMGVPRFNYLLWKLAALNARTATTVILLNQVRTRLADCVGSAEISPGGMAPKLLSAVRMELLPPEPASPPDAAFLPVRARLIKNRFHTPDRLTKLHLALPFAPLRPGDSRGFLRPDTFAGSL